MLQRSQADKLIALTKAMYPNWSGFDDPRFQENEIDYKQKAVKYYRPLLGEETLKRLIQDSAWSEIKKRLIGVASKTNLLFQGVPKSGDLAVLYDDDVDLSLLCPQILKLLHGDGAPSERIDAYSQFAKENDLPNLSLIHI